MKISKRLEAIASYVDNGSHIIDVGCDHALLDIYLVTEKNCTALAVDINQKALDQAKYNIARYHAPHITTMLNDGIDGIQISNRDVIVISGMGTSTIEHILSDQKLSNHLIISTHNEFERLRRFMSSLGYMISHEEYLIEKGIYYIIMDFVKGEHEYSDEDYMFGPFLKHNEEYMAREYQTITDILSKVPDDALEKEELEHKLDMIKQLI